MFAMSTGLVGVGDVVVARVNVAVQALFPSMVTGGVAHGPVHPAKLEPLAGVAVGLTCVPALYVPAPIVVPVPLPLVVIVSVYCARTDPVWNFDVAVPML